MNYDEIIEFLVKEVGKKIEEEKTRKIEAEHCLILVQLP